MLVENSGLWTSGSVIPLYPPAVYRFGIASAHKAQGRGSRFQLELGRQPGGVHAQLQHCRPAGSDGLKVSWRKAISSVDSLRECSIALRQSHEVRIQNFGCGHAARVTALL